MKRIIRRNHLVRKHALWIALKNALSLVRPKMLDRTQEDKDHKSFVLKYLQLKNLIGKNIEKFVPLRSLFWYYFVDSDLQKTPD